MKHIDKNTKSDPDDSRDSDYDSLPRSLPDDNDDSMFNSDDIDSNVERGVVS